MASGVDVKNCPPRLLSGLIQTQLDNDLAEYYKFMAMLFAIGKDFKKANEFVDKYKGIVFPEAEHSDSNYLEKVGKILEDMDNWVVEIDKSSLPMPKGRVLRPKPLEPRPKKRRAK